MTVIESRLIQKYVELAAYNSFLEILILAVAP
jgi:hypothetical protein